MRLTRGHLESVPFTLPTARRARRNNRRLLLRRRPRRGRPARRLVLGCLAQQRRSTKPLASSFDAASAGALDPVTDTGHA